MAETINGYTICDYGNDAFDALKSDWLLLEKGADMTAFQSYSWYHGIHALFDQERTKNLFRKWRYIVVRKRDVPLLIAPLEIKLCGFGYKNYGAEGYISSAGWAIPTTLILFMTGLTPMQWL